MNLANFSVRRPITIVMAMVALIIVGVIAIPLLPVDLYPNLDIPTANVSVSWPGSSPAEVERQVTKPLESAMATVSGLSSLSSTSRSGSSNVTLQFNYGTNLDQVMLDMRDKLSRVQRSLPTDAVAPVVSRVDPNSTPIMSLALYGSADPISLRDTADNVVSPLLQQVDGVASVGSSGGRVRQVQILIDPSKLQQYNITLSAIQSAIGSDNNSADAGLVYKGTQLIPLHIDGQFKSVLEIGKVQVPIGKGATIALSELGQIEDTYQDVTADSRLNGQSSVSLSILKQAGGNTVAVSDGIKAQLKKIEAKLPAGEHLAVINDQAKFIKDSINTVIDHLLLGGAFAILILLFFLRSVRATLIIGIVIPIAIISTFSMMYFSSQTINTITLGGLAVGLGSLVDFAVVVLESIFRKRHEGFEPEAAAKEGAAEVGTAVLASALAQVCVFLPTVFISGISKQFFWPMALTVIFSHVAALFAAVTLVPMLAAKLMKGNVDEELPAGQTWNPFVWFGRGVQRLTRSYAALLRWSLSHRWVVIATTVALLAASVFATRFVGSELTPSTDQGQVNIFVSFGQGTSFEVTNKLVTEIEGKIKTIPEVETIFTRVGSQGGGAFQSSATNSGSIDVMLKADHKRTSSQVAEQIRSMTTGYPGARIGVSTPAGVRLPGLGGGFGGGGDVTVNLTGPDLNVLQKLGDEVAQQISTVPGTRNVLNTLDQTSPEYSLTIDRDAAQHFGVTQKDIMTALRNAYQGAIATQFDTGNLAINVLIKFPEQFTNNVENLNNISINTTSGAIVPLNQVAKVTLGSGPAQIRRLNQNRVAVVQANVFGATVGDVQAQVQQVVDAIQPPDGYTVTMGSGAKQQSSTFAALYGMLGISILLVYMVMASQFESLYGPFVIMFSLPPTFVGAILGLLVTHRTINMNSIIGMIMLVGIVVNNAIVLIDYTNQLRKRGMTLSEALVQAGQIRLRPILMTTCTTVLAMLPLVIGFGEGAETQASMATVVAFGLTLSTMVTLVLVPVVYTLMEDGINRIKRLFRRNPHTPAAPQEPSVTH